mmetsp:Transcript_52989/g.84482  ORF Transcript_52989/g.84482 Transcript_52989/m.84482 type:complete len:207 (-) Transcript_52989:283-903(-)
MHLSHQSKLFDQNDGRLPSIAAGRFGGTRYFRQSARDKGNNDVGHQIDERLPISQNAQRRTMQYRLPLLVECHRPSIHQRYIGIARARLIVQQNDDAKRAGTEQNIGRNRNVCLIGIGWLRSVRSNHRLVFSRVAEQRIAEILCPIGYLRQQHRLRRRHHVCVHLRVYRQDHVAQTQQLRAEPRGHGIHSAFAVNTASIETARNGL